MMIFPLDLEAPILRVLAFLSAIAGALLIVPRTREIVIGPVKAVLNRRRDQRAMISQVLHLLAPNGGSSLSDAVKRLEGTVSAIARDVTELVGGTTKLNELVFGSFDLQEQPLMYCDSDGDCEFANRSFCDVTGIRADDARGSGWTRALHGTDRLGVVEEIRAAAHEERAYSLVCRLVHQGTGSTTQVRAIGRPLRDRVGKISGHLRIFIVTARDVP